MLEYILGWQLPETICLIVGIVLLVCEMFTAGFGLLGGLGIASLIAAVVLRADSLQSALLTIVIVLAIIIVAGVFFIRSFKKGAISRSPVVLKEAVTEESTAINGLKDHIGRTGVCVNTLRPAGNADFDGERLDVVSEGEFIPKGEKVVIVAVEGVKIIVRKADA